MLETIAGPIILKTLDFIFGEGSKILKEILDRRGEKGNIELPSPNTIDTKEIAMQQPIIKEIWLDSEGRVKHLLSMLEIYNKNYNLAQVKYAKFGVLAPPIVLWELEDAENGIMDTMNELKTILGKVYDKKIIIKLGE